MYSFMQLHLLRASTMNEGHGEANQVTIFTKAEH
jgi:hypothetical protein